MAQSDLWLHKSYRNYVWESDCSSSAVEGTDAGNLSCHMPSHHTITAKTLVITHLYTLWFYTLCSPYIIFYLALQLLCLFFTTFFFFLHLSIDWLAPPLMRRVYHWNCLVGLKAWSLDVWTAGRKSCLTIWKTSDPSSKSTDAKKTLLVKAEEYRQELASTWNSSSACLKWKDAFSLLDYYIHICIYVYVSIQISCFLPADTTLSLWLQCCKHY